MLSTVICIGNGCYCFFMSELSFVTNHMASHPESLTIGIPDGPSPTAIRSQLERLLATNYFKTSPRLRRFLAYTVEQVLSASEQGLKEYTIALEVFSKPDSFDPRVDSAVRVAARQLRAKLDTYYLNEGAQDSVLIRFRPGGYVPRFYLRSPEALRFTSPCGTTQATTRVIVVEKDRSSSAAIADALDACSSTLLGIADSAESALTLMNGSMGMLVVTAISLSGGMSGIDLARIVRSQYGAQVIFVAPTVLTADLYAQIVETEPEAVIFKPVRGADVTAAVQLAIARRGYADASSGTQQVQQADVAVSA